ncbi:DUF393 domain-containing protein [Persicimonas caeni]|uniref:DUF393 domain-containing protein n=1 Tax=Persicimonas caeni TaxID=2292766 RepID=A0A4Y6Q1N2_PERCE|nr:DCC1-like thiol-disulfide oxidoreductase family protein [Persicimonas caeni]QDG54498.1 DUF393 domain-containing protein [Persicimonas caeni]QED35719.1 DUF393 domain-containing protein [Persicimonas caeni]
MTPDINQSEGFDPSNLDRPALVWDGDCGFCKRSVIRIARKVGEGIRYVTYQDVHERFDALDEADFAESVWFVEPDGRAYRGAEAIFRAYSWRPEGSLLLRMYHDVPGFAAASEWGYRRVANHRKLASRVADLLPGW